MAKKKIKTFDVTLSPVAGEKKRLPARNEGEKRTQLRNYHLEAESAEDARSIVEEQERRLADQYGTKPWKIEKVKAA